MGLETVTNGIEDLNKDWPSGIEPVSQGDDHLRNIKAALALSLPDAAGPYNNVADGSVEVNTSDTHKIWSPKDIFDYLAANWAEWNLGTGTGAMRVPNPSRQQIAPNTATKIQFSDTADFDPGSIWDGSNKRIVPNQAGIWRIHGLIHLDWSPSVSRSDDNWCQLRTAAATLAHAQVIADDTDQWGKFDVDTLAVFNGTTDYVEMYLQHGNGGVTEETVSGGANGYFEATFIGPAT